MSTTIGCSYFGNRIERHYRTDLAELKAQGFNAILHTFSENDFYFYRETMQEFVHIAREEGFATYLNPWGVGGVFGGEAFSYFVQKYSEERQILENGEAVPAACFHSTRFQNFLDEWLDAALHCEADYIFWDEPHWNIGLFGEAKHRQKACFCSRCQSVFQQQYEKPLANADEEEWHTFRDDALILFLQKFLNKVCASGQKNVVCVLPKEIGLTKLDFWEKMATLSSIDILATDPYWQALQLPLKPFFRNSLNDLKSIAERNNKSIQIWLQGFGFRDADFDDIAQAVSIMQEEKIDNVFVWGFLACGHMASLRPESPEKCWQTIVNALQVLAKNVNSI